MVLPDGFEDRFGFKPKSKQYNFLHNPAPESIVVLLLDSATPTYDVSSKHVIACAFGTYKDYTIELWHVGVFKDHPYNDSAKGQRWGVYGISKDSSGSKVRWKHDGGKTLTAKNHEKYVFGSANPNAVATVYKMATHFPDTRIVTQHSEMPCAQLFHPNYDHSTHPAIQLLYKSLGFVKSPLGNYVWYEENMLPLSYSFQNFLQRMSDGLDAS